MTTCHPLRKALTANSTAASFGSSQIPTATEPSGNGVFRLTDPQYGCGFSGRVPDRVLLIPFGGNDSNDVMNLRLWGWSRNVGSTLWVPTLLAELQATLGAITATAIAASMLLADTITVTYGDTNEKTLGVSVSSPANDVPGNALVHLRGCEYIEFDFKLGVGGDAMNCYWRPLTEEEC